MGVRIRRGLVLAAVTVVAAACSAAPSPPAVLPPAAETAPVAPPTTPAPVASAPRPCPMPCRQAPRTVARFDVARTAEASGVAASRRNPGIVYVLDDGPGTSSVLVVDVNDGRSVGELRIAGLDGTDTEDLAVARCAPGRRRSCIYIGDIGDNLRARASITVHRVPEPDLAVGAPNAALTAETAALRYPDAPHDAETLLVGDDGTIAIVTKAARGDGRGAARLYTADAFADATLRRRGRVRLPQPAVPAAAAVVGDLVTGGDAVEGAVVLRTYDALYELRGDGELVDFPTWTAKEIPAPAEPQGEAVAYAADGCGLLTVSEGSGRVIAVPCR